MKCIFSSQRLSSAVCPRSSVTACTLRCKSTRSPRSVWPLGAEAPLLCPYPGRMVCVAVAGRMVKRAWVGPTAAGAPAPPSATSMTSQRCPTCLTCRWPPRRLASTAAWSCSAEGPAPETPPTHRPLLPRPHPCPIRIRRSRLYWTGQTAMESSSCIHTLTHTCWDTHMHCWTIYLMTAQ